VIAEGSANRIHSTRSYRSSSKQNKETENAPTRPNEVLSESRRFNQGLKIARLKFLSTLPNRLFCQLPCQEGLGGV